MASGQIQVNHEALATCALGLDGSANELAESFCRINTTSEMLSGSWIGIAGGVFTDVIFGTLSSMKVCNDELSNIACSLHEANRLMEAVDVSEASSILEGGG